MGTSAGICCALSGAVVSFSDAPIVAHDVTCYAEMYGTHHSRLLASSLGWIQTKLHVDRCSGNSAIVMTNRRKNIRLFDDTSKRFCLFRGEGGG